MKIFEINDLREFLSYRKRLQHQISDDIPTDTNHLLKINTYSKHIISDYPGEHNSLNQNTLKLHVTAEHLKEKDIQKVKNL